MFADAPGMISVRKNRNGKSTSVGKINRLLARKRMKHELKDTRAERVMALMQQREDRETGNSVACVLFVVLVGMMIGAYSMAV